MTTNVVKGIDRKGLWDRIKDAFDGKNVPEIAKLLGKTKQSVYRWRDGETPGLDTLSEISQTRKVSLNWLLTGEGSRQLDQNGTSQPHLPDDLNGGEFRKALEERERIREAQMRLIVEQNNKIIRLLEQLVAKS